MDLILKKFFWVVPILVIMCCGVLAAKAANHLIEAKVLTGTAAAKRAASRPRPKLDTQKPPPSKDAGEVTTRNMFCSSCDPPKATEPTPGGPPSDDNHPPATSLPLALAATIVSENPAASAATIINTTSHRSGSYSVGDLIPEAGEVRKIRPKFVDFHNKTAGRVERIALGGVPAASPAVAATAPPPMAPTPPVDTSGNPEGELLAAVNKGVRKVGDNQYDIDRSLVDKVLADPSVMMRQARVVPSIKDGKPNGFKMYAIRPSSVYAKIGLQNGDTIQSINGFEMTSMDKAMEIYTKLRSASNLSISVLRRGAQVQMDYSNQMTRRLLFLAFIAIGLDLLGQPALAQEPPTPTEEGPRRRRRPRDNRPDAGPQPPATPPEAPPTAPPVITTPPAPIAPPATPPTATPGAPAGAPPLPATEVPGEDAELYKCRQFRANERVKVTLKPDTDLKDLVAWVMGFTCKSFIFGNVISGRANKVTLIAPSEMTPQEAYRLFLVALQTMNLTVVPKGRTLEIVETNRARETPLPVYRSGKSVPGQDQVVRVVLRPEHIGIDEMMAVVNAMKTSTGMASPIPSAGAIILTDYGSTIDKLMDVMKDVDAPTGTEKIYIIYLQNADAQDISQKLTEIFGIGRGGAATGAGVTPARRAQQQPTQPGQPPMPAGAPSAGPPGGSSTPSKIIPDTRTNSLIVIASERAYQRILALVKRLDFAAGGEATGTIHVYYLDNADAEQLQGTMNQLITGVAPPSRQQQPGQPVRPTNVPAAVQQQGAGQGAFEGQIKLSFDKPTNSLVVVSSPKDFFSLREVIRKLDKPRRQVFVEATIVEVAIDKARKIGFSYHGGAQFELEDPDDTTVIGGVEHKNLNSILINPVSLDGLIGGVIGPQIPGLSIPSVGVLFQMVQNNNEVNVLSNPNILTTDNEPAEISVGQNIPYQSSTFGSQVGNALAAPPVGGQGAQPVNPFLGLGSLGTSVARQDVALTLKLTPHISEAGFVRLEVDLEISDVLSENFGGLGPSWSKRKVKTPIVVRDQQPVVIGGLMADKLSVEESKVPLLGDIPLIGYLFKYTVKRKVKANLLVFLTPYVIKDQADIQRIFEQKVAERQEFIRQFSAFDDHEFEVKMDYRRKRGLLEEINKSINTADEDERLMREAEQQRQRLGEEGPVEMPPDLPGPGGTTSPEGMSPGQPMPPQPPPPPPPEGE